MITKWYEISCDHCKCAQHFQGTIQTSESQFRDFGGIVTRDKKHYCDERCAEKDK